MCPDQLIRQTGDTADFRADLAGPFSRGAGDGLGSDHRVPSSRETRERENLEVILCGE